MSKRKPAKDYQSILSERERRLNELGFKRKGLDPKQIIECRAPSCNKRVPREYTKRGYCLACVNKAMARKAEREHRQKLEYEAQHFYDHDSQFGAF